MRKSTQGLHFAGKGSKLVVYVLRITQEERTMIHITEVTTKAQLRQFVNFPIDLYRDVPQYIPGTYSDDLADWDREKNPAFSYCEARCWLASRDDGTLVGRIGAILSRKSNDKWGIRRPVPDGGGLGPSAGLHGSPRPSGLHRHGPGGDAGGGL